ncbi:competence/damage-inducible protein A [Zhouia amylolytica]|uniref:competence/damage-inducible protein A n=1 Tax=Zhouia amylolytica TaxID=376730 RepID=UPI0020CCDB4B|nr:competence/damage-inducible protein A [Zhouia amylolytica]MCQ0110161.1 competence/damage-inducible protein A [Zhouia amylolytica]
MNAEIITIGDEILIGQIVDTNSSFIAKALNKIGVSVFQMTSIQDERAHILNALNEAERRADIIILTGGLGPTKDDITKYTLCEYFNDELVENEAVLKHVEALFKKYLSVPLLDVNKKQAWLPSKAEVLFNNFGTAPGMWFAKGEKIFVSLPGVPFEMKSLIEDEVIPRIQNAYKTPYILHKTILTYGIGESALADLISDWEDNLPSFVRLAYLPNLGKVRLRLTAKGDNRELIDSEVAKQIEVLRTIIGDAIYGLEEEDSIEALIARLFTEKNKTLSVAESCTGGKLAEAITAVPGASKYFRGGVVAYATDTKVDILKVSESLINQYSVVSAEVSEAMALGVKKLYKSDYSMATTGNAGPTKGDSEAELGTVYIAIATPSGVFSEAFNFGNHRERVVNKAVNKAFEMLQKEILKN